MPKINANAPNVDIEDRIELFVDNYLIDSMENVEQRMHEPILRDIAVKFDAPWEGSSSTYVTIFPDGEKFRMYYSAGDDKTHEEIAYAESDDGIHWTKPNLGIYEFNGSTENNIVWIEKGTTTTFSPFLDTNPKSSPEEKYKAIAGIPPIALSSSDGIHWKKMKDSPVMTRGAFDSQNVVFWDSVRGSYSYYFRITRDRLREIAYSHSDDFVQWSFPRPIERTNFFSKYEHFYTNAIVPYFRAPHILLAFPMRFVEDRKKVQGHVVSGVSGSMFMTSRDAKKFDNRFMESFLRPGPDKENWTDRTNMIAQGVIPTGKNEISIFYTSHYRHPSIHLARATLRLDGFVSIKAPYVGGEFVTNPIIFKGKELRLNMETSEVGNIFVELLNESGKPISGFSLAHADELYGDEIEQVVTWQGNSDISQFEGKPIRLRFVMKDADLYSIRFR